MNQKQQLELCLKMLTDRKHLDNEVDRLRSRGIGQSEAYDQICDFMRSVYADIKLPYKNAESYWQFRNRKRRQRIKNKVTKPK